MNFTAKSAMPELFISYSGSGKQVAVSELDVYGPPEEDVLEHRIPPPTAFEQSIGIIRRNIWAANDSFKEKTAVVTSRYNAAKSYAKGFTDVVKAEKDILPKTAAISLAAVIGYAVAGRSRGRRILFPVIGSAVTAGVCFPNVAYKPITNLYYSTKDRFSQPGQQDKPIEVMTIAPALQPTQEPFPMKDRFGQLDLHNQQGNNGRQPALQSPTGVATQREEGSNEKEESTVQEKVTEVEQDLGQSDPKDNDMYTEHSR
eukprot:m.16941 g.16941  ORF g.16941 m.16941 type:complete len:258 (+) comp27215_c0_seq1:15-788(+)